MIYEPGEDSHLLSKNLKRYVKNKSVLDMGSGSGIQAETALKNGASSVLAVDINPASIKLLKQKNIPCVKSNLFSKVKGKFDIIVFNPPYLPLDSREDPESTLITSGGKAGYELTLKFLKSAKEHLTKKGTILLIVSSLTPQDKINALIKKLGLRKKVVESQSFFMETLSLIELKTLQ